MSAILQEIISLLVAGITQFATGIGSGLQSLVTNIFIKTGESGNSLSEFGGLIVIFGAISLTIGLCYYVVNFLTSWGN